MVEKTPIKEITEHVLYVVRKTPEAVGNMWIIRVLEIEGQLWWGYAEQSNVHPLGQTTFHTIYRYKRGCE